MRRRGEGRAGPPRSRGGRQRRRRAGGNGLLLLLGGAAIVVALVVLGRASTNTLAVPAKATAPRPRAPISSVEPATVSVAAPRAAVAATPPSPNAASDGGRPATSREPSATASPIGRSPARGPRVAIVIDDCGQRLDLLQRAVRIPTPLTFAVIPWLPYSRESGDRAFAAGHEVILHQPMEPDSATEDPGRGALRVGMRESVVARVLSENLASIPHAVGWNNHMGSRGTADPVLMGHALAATRSLRRDLGNLYFLDSRTTAGTVGGETARRLGVPTATRSVFLDNEPDPVAIRAQLALLLRTASEKGEAIGIGHLKPDTLAVLESILPTVPEDEAVFVFASEIVQ